MTLRTTSVVIRVLLVDDHRLVADSVGAALDAHPDLQVLAVVSDGASALEAVRQHQPDVVLLDQALPDTSGTALTPKLLAASPQTKVVLVTGSDDDDLVMRGIEAGCSGLVPKGRPLSVLVDAVRSAAAGDAVIEADTLARVLPQLVRRTRRLGDDLTPREREVLGLLVQGMHSSDLARDLHISHATVRNHIQALLTKLAAHSQLEAVAIALREGIVELPR